MQYQDEQDYTKRINFQTWKKLLANAKGFSGYYVGIIVSMGAIAIIDALIPLMTRTSIDRFIVPRTTDGLADFLLMYALLLIIQIICVFLFIFFAARVECGMIYTIRKEGFKRLQTLPFAYYDRTPVGFLMSRMTSDASHLGEAFSWVLVDLVWGVIYLIASYIAMFMIDARLALIVLLIVPPLAIVSHFFQKKILKNQRAVRKANSQITSAFNEGIMGAKATKTLVTQERQYNEFSRLSEHMKRCSVHAAAVSSVYPPLIISISSIATAYVLTEGGYLVLHSILTLGTITAFVNYTLDIFDPIHNIAATFSEMQRMQAAAERVVSMLETESDIQDSPEVESVFGDNFHPKKSNWPSIRGDIDFENVSFHYQGGDEVLKNFNLSVKAGEVIALVGPTGAGKSTIVNLLCRFYEPTEGVIKIDGVDYKQRSQLWLQSNLGYVLQEPHLFSGTITENIRYGRQDATDEEVKCAARLVNAENFILSLEKGYDTQVGESGSRLSIGEKQLISFARAVLSNPALFVLDEATSSVDTKTEAIIQHAIEKTLEGRTSFIIAHRLSTIRNADRILVVDHGKVIESGTHKELMAQKGQYYVLYTNQFKEEQSRAVLGHFQSRSKDDKIS